MRLTRQGLRPAFLGRAFGKRCRTFRPGRHRSDNLKGRKGTGFAGLFGFWRVISLNLGVFNLCRSRLLDGGQIMVLGIEKVMSWFGKTLSMAVSEKIQLAGLAVILLLMVFTLFLDISRFF